jgi:hypothetical protein
MMPAGAASATRVVGSYAVARLQAGLILAALEGRGSVETERLWIKQPFVRRPAINL